jgi:hypothetical protein
MHTVMPLTLFGIVAAVARVTIDGAACLDAGDIEAARKCGSSLRSKRRAAPVVIWPRSAVHLNRYRLSSRVGPACGRNPGPRRVDFFRSLRDG